jgi:Zn-dependent M32 family carboxypeptidase
MQPGPPDLRDIPILTEAVEEIDAAPAVLDASVERYDKDVRAAILTETLLLADSLLHQAAKDIETTLFERVFDQLRAQLPDLVDRIFREHTPPRQHPHDHG